MTQPAQHVLPRWRGFNLIDFVTTRSNGLVSEDDFRWIRDWGFDFVRLPMCYLLWTEPDDVYKVRQPMLANIDRAVEIGRRHGIHICLNFHRAPGYSVSAERAEPFDLWHDQTALDAFCFHWELMARRYLGIPSKELSFNLVNEPARPGLVSLPTYTGMTLQDHERVMRAAVAAIKRIDPDRLIILDGVDWGGMSCPELADLGVAQSCRGYRPSGISHYKATWIDTSAYPPPAWPGGWHYGKTWDRATLEQHYAPWAAMAARGVGVHCGEGGAYIHTPHEMILRWYRDVLEILTSHNIGHTLWHFRGPFGILDSGRSDVAYEDWHGHKLDRKMLELLREF